jgi:hypothetical protein
VFEGRNNGGWAPGCILSCEAQFPTTLAQFRPTLALTQDGPLALPGCLTGQRRSVCTHGKSAHPLRTLFPGPLSYSCSFLVTVTSVLCNRQGNLEHSNPHPPQTAPETTGFNVSPTPELLTPHPFQHAARPLKQLAANKCFCGPSA